jgi:hypothetical protein
MALHPIRPRQQRRQEISIDGEHGLDHFALRIAVAMLAIRGDHRHQDHGIGGRDGTRGA